MGCQELPCGAGSVRHGYDVLIALEFGNSILRHIREHSTIVQARAVILIGMMAVVREVMIIDLSVASPWQISALGAVAVLLASAYWFMRDN
ncbi:phosphate-starvation-inducible PsiE family protein [Phaeobacter inhibens]|uniref:phosphate-starvation-inducible PsiE family protein n=1 Tax=Phaeobacter inhibens TaxID=221822 RepID=UPI001314A799|nr:phosphate-starvation-inducible PsiE family protein [Phaeobacter inhibens]UWR83931.1 phosphate-starvation-inducible PsiE family protein [Phaeobacter inhibens]